MKKEIKAEKKLNILALVSILLIPLLLVGLLGVLLNRMYQFIPMRDIDVSPFIMFLAVALVLGIGMLVTGITAVLQYRKNKEGYKGTWMAFVGLVFGAVSAFIPLFFLVDYLIQTKK